MTEKYLESTFVRCRLWITDRNDEVQQINEEFCKLVSFKRDHNFAGSKFRAVVRVDEWVHKQMHSGKTDGWNKRLAVLLLDNGLQKELPFRILSMTFFSDGDHTQYNFVVDPLPE